MVSKKILKETSLKVIIYLYGNDQMLRYVHLGNEAMQNKTMLSLEME